MFLSAAVTSRPHCHWGKNCRTQTNPNNPHHARCVEETTTPFHFYHKVPKIISCYFLADLTTYASRQDSDELCVYASKMNGMEMTGEKYSMFVEDQKNLSKLEWDSLSMLAILGVFFCGPKVKGFSSFVRTS